jgi:hypothetical protein
MCSRLKLDLSDNELGLLDTLNCRSGRLLLDEVGDLGYCDWDNEFCARFEFELKGIGIT